MVSGSQSDYPVSTSLNDPNKQLNTNFSRFVLKLLLPLLLTRLRPTDSIHKPQWRSWMKNNIEWQKHDQREWEDLQSLAAQDLSKTPRKGIWSFVFSKLNLRVLSSTITFHRGDGNTELELMSRGPRLWLDIHLNAIVSWRLEGRGRFVRSKFKHHCHLQRPGRFLTETGLTADVLR